MNGKARRYCLHELLPCPGGAPAPSRSELSDAVAKDLKQRGFKFLGSIIIYSHLQATGIINDHVTGCFRYREIKTGYEEGLASS
jgi:3-methyladenine DNA glycosylase Tag